MKKIFCTLLAVILLLVYSVAFAASIPQPVLDARESTVYIEVDIGDGYYSSGSGFAIGANAPVEYVITNYHVVDEMVGACTVFFGDYTPVNATVAVSLPDKDLSVLKLDNPISVMNPLPLYSGDPSDLAGEQVYALGFPAVADNLFERGNSVRDDVTMTDGIISAVKASHAFGTGERAVTGLQMNVALNHGNSGGPLVNGEGIVVGVNTIGSVEDSNLNGALCISELLSTLDAKGISYLSGSLKASAVESGLPWATILIIAAAAVIAVLIVVRILHKRRNAGGKTISLNAYLSENSGKIGYDMTVYMLAPVFAQLKKAHESGQCLLGIYPENIRFYPEMGRTGFVPPKKQTLCTGYSAPEQYKEIPQTGPWTDVYQLGAVLYRMLTGARLADVMTRAEDDGETARSIEGLNLDPTKKQALLHTVSLNRNERFVDAGQLLNALGIDVSLDFVNMPQPSVYGHKQKKERKKFSKKAKGLIAAVICIAGVFCGFFSYWTINRQNQNKAIQFLNGQNFSEAKQLLDSIPDFIEPSIPDLKKLAHAGALYESGDYETALAEFEALGDYSYAPQMIEVIYQKFDPDYRNKIAEIEETLSSQGVAAAYEQLKDFDSSKMSEHLKSEYYKLGLSNYDSNKIEEAVIYFILLDDYKGSDSLAVNIAVEYAKKWINDYNYIKAYNILKPFGDNSEASRLMNVLMALVDDRGWLSGNDGYTNYDDGHWEGRMWVAD